MDVDTNAEEIGKFTNSTKPAVVILNADADGASVDPKKRKRKSSKAAYHNEEMEDPCQKMLKGKHEDCQNVPGQLLGNKASTISNARASSPRANPQFRLIPDFLENLVLTFPNFSASDSAHYQQLPSSHKAICFEITWAVLKIFETFILTQDPGDLAEQNLTLACEQLNSLLSNLKCIGFSFQVSSAFELSHEMQETTMKSCETISLEQIEFLNFLNLNFPLMEILYVMRAAKQLCLCY